MTELVRLFDDLESAVQKVRHFDETVQQNLSNILAGKLINLTICLQTAIAAYPSNEKLNQHNSTNTTDVDQKLVDEVFDVSTPVQLQEQICDGSYQLPQSEKLTDDSHIEHVMHIEEDTDSAKRNTGLDSMDWTPVIQKRKLSKAVGTKYKEFADQVILDGHFYNDYVSIKHQDDRTRTVCTGNSFDQVPWDKTKQSLMRQPFMQNRFLVLQDLDGEI